MCVKSTSRYPQELFRVRRVRRKCETICWHEHDRAIRESQLVRDEARKDRMNARMAVARAHATLHRARVEGDQSVAPYGEAIIVTQTTPRLPR